MQSALYNRDVKPEEKINNKQSYSHLETLEKMRRTNAFFVTCRVQFPGGLYDLFKMPQMKFSWYGNKIRFLSY